ncbi:CBS domain-containing protein [uncultured Hoeflea sp.]|uniref:CBS domain-containing protein n=1 Tax=uncultured Hoeflea sp. TaxID=538666 RepID=UPI00262FDC0C|nr:CBS domain-containing protein [uncultured Hoeflea sp.]
MHVHQIMSRPVKMIGTAESIGTAAGLMRQFAVGVLPVVNPQGVVVGIVTDRDLILGLAWRNEGPLAVSVDTVMTSKVVYGHSDQMIEEIAAIMGDNQVRRLPILDRSGLMVGIVSIGDIAENASEKLAGETLGEIVEAR